jgi:nucleotide-binding universal stress UspA family protein
MRNSSPKLAEQKIAPAGDAPIRALHIKRILIPVDFSESGQPALKYGQALARLTGASVQIVHVLETLYRAPEFEYPQIDAELREQATRWIGGIQVKFFDRIRSDFEVREGLPFLEIVDAAKRCKADLIVMATHGHTGLKHLVLGSTAERVIRHAKCPVLIVRSPKPGKKSGKSKRRASK